jgi:tetratricopeptide (TPR) repeat protein
MKNLHQLSTLILADFGLDIGVKFTHGTDSVEQSAEGRREALRELQKAVRLDPNAAESHLYLGRLFRCMASDYGPSADATASAIEHLHLAAQLAPSDPVRHYELAASLNPETDKPEMISELRTCLQLFEERLNPIGRATPSYPDNRAEAMWLLGIILAEKDPTLAEGAELMKRAITRIDNPDLTTGKRGRLADLLREKGHYREP